MSHHYESAHPAKYHIKIQKMFMDWKRYHQTDMIRHCYYQAMATPILELVLQHLKHSIRFPQLHWGSQHLSVSLQDTVAEFMADWLVRLKSLFKIDKINTLDMNMYGSESRYLRNHSTLEEFITTCDAPLFDSFSNYLFKIVTMTFQQHLATRMHG